MGTKKVAESRVAYVVHSPAPQRISLAAALFSSTRQRVLGLLFGQPERTFYGNEVIALAQGGTGAVQRELARLEQSELVAVTLYGRQKHYRANAASPIFHELCGIVQKTTGLADPLRTALAPLAGRIRAAFVYGSVAKRQDTASSDVDLLIVSDDVVYGELYMSLEELSQRLGRKVNPTIYTSKELAQRIKRGDAFVKRVMAQDKIWLVGDGHALGL
ncbi:MAG: nucleotidyltransferase domain-containing protein [Caldimonas sp.]